MKSINTKNKPAYKFESDRKTAKRKLKLEDAI